MKNVALITGASGGIGSNFARVHANKGGDLILIGRNEKKLNSLKVSLEDHQEVNVMVIVKDLSKENAAKEIFEEIEKFGIKVNILINNAGFGGHGKFVERDFVKDQRMIQVNLTALTELTYFFANHMIKNGGGKILNVSSVASFMPGPLQSVYYATKAYVTSFSQAIAEELKEDNITVTALCPGAVDTGFALSSDLKGVKAFENAKNALSVAEIGYKAMLDGKLIVFNEKKLSFISRWILPLMPRKLVLKISRSIMEKEHLS